MTKIISGKLRNLPKADYKPQVHISVKRRNGKNLAQHHLVTTRNGFVTLLPISRRVAEELIASGYSYGN